MSTTLFGKTYAAPFGVAPVGLQGLIWPNSPNILAKAANEHNVPFILSTVTTSAIDDITKITNGNFWCQLYCNSSLKNLEKLVKSFGFLAK